MKRLVVLSVVAFLVVTAGCGMTSPAADEARDGGGMETATTTTTGSSPSDTAPLGEMLPDGYSQAGIEDPQAAIAQHQTALSNESYRIIFKEATTGNDSETLLTTTTNVSMDEKRWLQTQQSSDQGLIKQVYQGSDSKAIRTVGTDGSETVTTESSDFSVTTGTPDNVTLEAMLEKVEVSGAEAASMGSVDFIELQVTAYDGHPVEAAHFYVYPSGQIRVLMVKYENKQVSYISVSNGDTDVTKPAWVDNSSDT